MSTIEPVEKLQGIFGEVVVQRHVHILSHRELDADRLEHLGEP